MFKYKYINPENEENLKIYKYQGADLSPISKYILSPFANICLEKFVPEWIAPNVLTLMGLICVLIPHFIFLYMFGNNLHGDVPSWLLILTGVLHLVYMVGVYLLLGEGGQCIDEFWAQAEETESENFDNLDGKQARKTGNASPLGLLFDHGCDSLVIFVQGINIAISLQCGNSIYSFSVFFIGSILFYLATLEEYYTEILILPFINGPSEGCLVIAGLFILTGFVGCQFWNNQDILFPFPRRDVLLGFFFLASTVNALFNIYQLFTKVRKNFGEALKKTLFFWYIIISALLLFTISPSNVVARKGRFVLYIIGLNFAKLVSHLQMAHVSKSEFKQFRRSTFFILTVLNLNMLSGIFFNLNIDEDSLVLIMMIASFVVYSHLCINVINQFTQVLNIRAFFVKKKDASGKKSMARGEKTWKRREE